MCSQITKEKLNKETIIEILLKGEITLAGQFTLGSNYTFLVDLIHQKQTIKAVYKPMKGETPLWDFPPETLATREAAAYVVSEAAKWELVPPTIMRENGPFGKGSLQLFVPHDPNLNYFTFNSTIRQRLKPTAIFDILINNADRKGSHIILDKDDHIWLIDHGLCFHPKPKIRTVIWDFSNETIDNNLILQLENLLDALKSGTDVCSQLVVLLSNEEIAALKKRILFIINHPVFPSPDKDKRQYPWPLV